MIKLLRVDDRLIHGQVAMTWTSYLQVNMIVVADDTSAKDQFASMALNLAKPPGVTLEIKTVEDAVALLSQPRAEKIFVVCATTDAALTLSKGIPDVHDIVLGGIRKAGDKIYIERQVFLDAQDIQNCEEMVNLGKNLRIQVVPSEKHLNLDEAKNIYKKGK